MLRMIMLMGQDDGSWFMAHGSRLMAHGQGGASPALVPEGAPGPDPGGPGAPSVPRAAPLAMSHEPWALSHEPWTIKHASSMKHQASVLWPINTPRKLKHIWPDRSRSFSGTRLFQILRLPGFQIWRLANLKMLSLGDLVWSIRHKIGFKKLSEYQLGPET